MIPYYIIPGLKSRKVKFYRLERSDMVIKKICEHFNITSEILKKHNRSMAITEPRFICWYILYTVVGLTLCQIASIFDFNHTTVMYGLRRCDGLMQTEQSFKDKVNTIKELLKPEFPEFT